MKRLFLLSCCLLTLLFLANVSSASAQPCQTSTSAALDLQALTSGSSPALSTPATPARPDSKALPSDPVDGRTDRVCFWYPTGVCCAGGYQIEEWICDPSLTRCGPRTC